MDGLIIKKEWLDLVFTNTVNIDTLASKGMTQNEVISTLKDELHEYSGKHEQRGCRTIHQEPVH